MAKAMRYEVTTEFNGTKTAQALHFGTKEQCYRFCEAHEHRRKRGHAWVLVGFKGVNLVKHAVNLNETGSVRVMGWGRG